MSVETVDELAKLKAAGYAVAKTLEMMRASEEILRLAIGQVRDRFQISELGGFIEKEAKARGFRDRYNRDRLRKGDVIALETFISTHARMAEGTKDGWTMIARGGGFVAQHEHTLAITDADPIVLIAANGIAYQ